jgi:hypothetical protein
MDISADLLRYGKRDNSKAAHKAKVTIRENVLGSIGEKDAQVFDCCSGEGQMYRAVWHRAADYCGCDRDWFPHAQHKAFKADNRRVLRAIGLQHYTVFDVDTWGSPWEALYIIAVRRPLAPEERLGLVMTDKALGKVAGIRTHMPGMGAARDDIIERALRRILELMHAKVERRWQANGDKGSRVRYMGMILRGN